jgi:hypothetical protein
MTAPHTRLPAGNILKGRGISQWVLVRMTGLSQGTISQTIMGHQRTEAVIDAIRTLCPDLSDMELFGESFTTEGEASHGDS